MKPSEKKGKTGRLSKEGMTMRSLSSSSCPFFVSSYSYAPKLVTHNLCSFPPRQLSTAKKRLRFSPNATSIQLPLLPFNMNEVLVPSESKVLHLYEARYIALLEESLLRKKLFVHFVLDPISISDSATEASFAARYGCLVRIENVEQLDVGALVSIRGIGRVKIINFLQADPYLQGEVMPMQDRSPESSSNVSSKVLAVKEAVYNLNSLEIKLKAPKEAVLQTRILNSLLWADKEPSLDCDEAFIPSLPERVSFSAFQPVSGSTQSELLKLQQEKLKAMDFRETEQRLNNSLELVKENISMLAAKLAIQSIEMQ
ncbi:ATP-dependent protease La (LON) domain protein [Melia azedarach]|uniref:ATP-dependent protease La (LON) domain protein n=1 Tax=Melia azedarach TaxID=155640 RepID=A0ACC1WQR9_MELAZ|nr:ATP-dependent protease La (LON) domain protein [Melia azedarach]